MTPMRAAGGWRVVAVWLAGMTVSACSGAAPGPAVEIVIPSGATFGEAVDSLAAHRVVTRTTLFGLYARLKGADTRIRSGRYSMRPGTEWSQVLRDLIEGRVVTEPMTVPEGFTLEPMSRRIAELTGADADSVLALLTAADAEGRWGVPGPGLEGYLFPDTYRFAEGVPVEDVIGAMTDRYRAVWTPARRAALDSLTLDEREVVTLASIIEAEALRAEEMPIISAVYHNRLRIGYLLQADPTVMYALGGRRERLLYAAIDSVADNPYNTYTQPGLPPGPIGAPGEAAIEAALHPADVDFLYFVARPDGSHIFTRSLEEHNRARGEVRRLQRESAAGR